MRLLNRTALIKLIEQYGAELVLHGHLHTNGAYNLPNRTPVLSSGDGMSYNVIYISNSDISFKVVQVKKQSRREIALAKIRETLEELDLTKEK